ncbi:unnamed protein product [Effrenium voratum]|nr:unnamed protein product [Effrenium voratum]
MGTCCSEQQIVEDTPFLITRSNEEFVVDAFTLKVFARTMWPILTKFGEGVVKDELMPKVNAKLPSHLAISASACFWGKDDGTRRLPHL